LASADNRLFTNQHCISTNAAATNTDYEFGAEAPTCGSPNGQLQWPGAIFSGQVTVGPEVMKNRAAAAGATRLGNVPTTVQPGGKPGSDGHEPTPVQASDRLAKVAAGAR
jgi:hypothetical protein